MLTSIIRSKLILKRWDLYYPVFALLNAYLYLSGGSIFSLLVAVMLLLIYAGLLYLRYHTRKANEEFEEIMLQLEASSNQLNFEVANLQKMVTDYLENMEEDTQTRFRN